MGKQAIQKWHMERHRDVTSTFGDLTLEALIDISDQKTFDDIPGIWRPNLEQGSGLIALFEREEDVCNSQGDIVAGEMLLETDIHFVAIGHARYAMATAQPGSPFLLAVYNEHHEALSRFSHIEHFAYNGDHIYIGHYVDAEEKAFAFQHTGDVTLGRHEAGRLHQSTVIIAVDIAGQSYTFRPFASGAVDIIVFRDTTSDYGTYSVGRMIVVENLEDGQVKLDFNKAFLPPCAFSPHFNCPMPPVGNRIKTDIDAGEKKVVWSK